MRPRPEAVENSRPTPAVPIEECFNAATARRPWRTQPWAILLHPLACFNAATARSRGERTSCRTPPLPLGTASMRPRPEDRGEPTSPKARRAKEGQLQCGHGPKTVENALGHAFARRICSSFNAATARRPWRTSVGCWSSKSGLTASMRPRPEDRGELEYSQYTRPELTLQCGHGPKTVENGKSLWQTAPVLPVLQCGHGPKTVENSD